jgi:hypothetical protein
MVGLTILPGCVHGRAQTQPLGFDQARLIEKFVAFDVSQNGGRGSSDSPDSAALGWGEGYVLDAYLKMYRVTGDSKWLTKIVEHFDRIIANMTDHDGDGIPGWHTDSYSVAEVRTYPLYNRGTARITPEMQRITDSVPAHAAKAGEYVVEFSTLGRYAVRNLSNFQILHSGTFASGAIIEGIPGVSVAISGAPEPGDKFRIESRGVDQIEYAVHEGMVLYPIAQFIEIALRDPTQRTCYETKARAYLKLIEDRILRKQERYWLDMTDRGGGYRFTENRSEQYPNRLLPHNQYLALGRVWLVLKDLSDNPLYLDRAIRMATYFKQNLRRTGDAYTWNYWDWIEGGMEGHSRTEDTSHGHIDVSFAVEAWNRGVVFIDQDMRRLTRTLLDQMWNGSMQDPNVGAQVDSKVGSSATFIGWADLCAYDPKVFDLMWVLYRKNGEPALYAPTLALGWAMLHKSHLKGWTHRGELSRQQ